MFDQTEFTEGVLHELEALKSLCRNNAGYRVEQRVPVLLNCLRESGI